MRVLIVTHFFPPEELPAAFLAYEFAKAVRESGHAVDVLTGFPNWPDGRPFPGFNGRRVVRENVDSINVVRLPFWASPNGSFVHRVLDFKSFAYLAWWHGRRLQRPDIIYVLVPANEDALTARRLARHFGCPYIVNTQDVHPDTAIELGYIRNPLVISLLHRQERKIYQDCAYVTAIGEGIKLRLVKKGIPAGKIAVLPNWINADEIIPTSGFNSLRQEWDLPNNKFIVLYAGTFGRIHDTSQLLEAARKLKNDGVFFLLVGQGHDFAAISRRVEDEGFQNVLVKPYVPRSKLCELQALADVSVAMVRRGFGHTSVPSKVLGYMSAGKPVIAMVDADCDTADLVRAADCGVVIDPGNISAFVKEIRNIKRDPVQLKKLGQNARKHIVTRLSPQTILPVGVSLLEDVASRFKLPSDDVYQSTARISKIIDMIMQMTINSLDDVVDIHLKSFKGFFLTFLGAKFLNVYYQSVVNHKDAIKFLYIEDSTIKGFIVGTMNPSGFYTALLKQDWFRFGIAALPAVLKKPQSSSRLLRAFAKPTQTLKDRGIVELSSIAVLPDAQKGGIGEKLLNAFVNEAEKRGAKAVYLTTDAYNNEAVNGFYQKHGFAVRRVFETPDKRVMNEYWLDIR